MANIFPRGANWLPIKILICLAVLGTAVPAAMTYYFTPKYTRVGYQPVQPVSFPHNIHVDQLGMDCRYCHSLVEVASHSNVPTTQVCMNCHSQVQKDNPKLKPVMESWETGKPIEWVQIHKTPDYVYYNHAVHVNRGISCVSCHGKVNEMPVVYHAEAQSMGWCLECHREPEKHLRPVDQVTNLNWVPPTNPGESTEAAQLRIGKELKEKMGINPPDKNCFGCHR
ncbi:cytochrome c3 family protein [Verrucomicrobiota bacterium sgz303538]